MKAIVCSGTGAEGVLEIREIPAPKPGARELRIEVCASGINRADMLQRKGLYPPPDGVSELLGLEVSGRVAEVGKEVNDFEPGERVMALLAGGGYASEVVVDAGSVMRVPPSLRELEAAGLPEAFLTAHLNLIELGGLRLGMTALVHGGSGGVGTAAIQLAREIGARILVTAGSGERCRRTLELGAELAMNYREDDWVEMIRDLEGGVDVILDCVGGAYLQRNISVLRTGGRLVVIGLMGGARSEINLAPLLSRRISIIGSTLRSRSPEEKAQLVSSFQARFGRALAEGRIRPIIDRILPFERVDEAHRLLTTGEVFGKILLKP